MSTTTLNAQPIPVFGGPAFDNSHPQGGIPIAGSAYALGPATEYDASLPNGTRAFRWDTAGQITEFDNLGTSANGNISAVIRAANAAGISVGWSTRYVSSEYKGPRAVRWSASGAITELGGLGTDANGVANSDAFSINSAGIAVGFAQKYEAPGVFIGERPVRWDPLQATGIELPTLSLTNPGIHANEATAINNAGTIVGFSAKYDGSNNYLGTRPVRWDTSGNITELGVLSLSGTGSTDARPVAINSTGTAVGWVYTFDLSGAPKGQVAVRWDAGSTAATELGRLGNSSDGGANAMPSAINDAGTAVGGVLKFVAGVSKGYRAAKWDASGTAATELQVLSSDSTGVANTHAQDINSAGLMAGYGMLYNQLDETIGQHAIVWNPDGSAVDLNSLIDSNSGWVLEQAFSISDDNWVAGRGMFDPDSALGALPAYPRLFLIQVPEPTAFGLVAFCIAIGLRRRPATR